MTVISHGPLMIVRVPLISPKTSRGKWKHIAKWTEIRSAVGAIMRDHGVRLKDISAIENYSHPDDWDPNDLWLRPNMREEAIRVRNRIAQAFAGDEMILPSFSLYDWIGGTFVIVRDRGKR